MENLANWRDDQGVGMRLGHLVVVTQNLQRLGRSEEAVGLLEPHREYRAEHDLVSRTFVLAQLSLLHACVGRFDEAARTVIAVNAHIRAERLTVPGMSGYIYGAPARALYLCALNARRTGALDEPAQRRAFGVQAGGFRAFARSSPVARAGSAWVDAMEATLSGAPARAARHLRRGLAEAERFGLQYDAAQAHLALASCHAIPRAEQDAHRAQAARGLDATGSGWLLVKDGA